MYKKKNITEYTKEAILIHNNLYDYNDSKYNGSDQSIKINCRIHGPFTLNQAREHIKNENKKNHYIKEFKKVHGELYDYSMYEYSNVSKKEIKRITTPPQMQQEILKND